ncbi:MAG TPA: ATP-binding protein [Candidatus Baltobacteraceae bacterium]|jgi:hypothetical protein
MLGRQQIAGIPTAISELFKNSYDAYAHNAVVDFYRGDNLFVLRDDGIGMSRTDFEQRWLTIGTESKLDISGGLTPPKIPKGEPIRPVLGEKGIGRLAIATIGEMLLILTRSRFPESKDRIVTAFLHWGVFALPGIDLDELSIPLREFDPDSLPDGVAVSEMTSFLASSIEPLSKRTDKDAVARIVSSALAFNVDPAALDRILDGPRLRGHGGFGTHFFVAPTDEMFIAALDTSTDSDRASNLQRALLGFTNTMTPEHEQPPIVTAFRDHFTASDVEDLIAESAFFTPEEFLNADHRIKGRFDEFGQFNGTIWIYGEAVENHVIPYSARGEASKCGPFTIDVAIVQGREMDSTLPPTDWVALTKKMDRLGGLYVYKDDIRVLPYGNNDYDFLEIEKRRTLSAMYYYFSFRRMFGAIQLTREQNSALQEKAGREGFRENRAYQDFRAVLINFFIQLAVDFFREGARSSKFHERRTDINRRNKAAQLREKRVRVRRSRFEEQLQNAVRAIEDGTASLAVEETARSLRDRLNAAILLGDSADAERALIAAERDAREQLRDIRTRYRVVPPRGIGLPRALRRDLEIHRSAYERFIAEIVVNAEYDVELALAEATSRADVRLDRRLVFYNSIEQLSTDSRSATTREVKAAIEASNDVEERVAALTKSTTEAVERTIREVLSLAQSVDVASLKDADFVEQRSNLERQLEDVVEQQQETLKGVMEQIRSIRWVADESGDVITESDETEALEEEVFALRDRAEVDLELAQLGMSVQIINHEFEASIRSVRRRIRDLKAWADINKSLVPVYDGIRASFDHLDGYLTLFAPLQRRLYRKPVSLRGTEIAKYVSDLFTERLRRHEISLETSAQFRTHVLKGYPSTLFPVAVNLVDNALFWLDERREGRRILFSSDDNAILVSNNGPAINPADYESIFELGFTRRPGGRGLGLAIAREALRRDGFDIALREPPEGMNVCFAIVERATT